MEDAVARIPVLGARTLVIRKRQCRYSFETLEDFPTGLYVNLEHLHALSHRFLEIDFGAYGCPLYLHLQIIRYKQISQPGELSAPALDKNVLFSFHGRFPNALNTKVIYVNGEPMVEVHFATLVFYPSMDRFIYPSEVQNLTLAAQTLTNLQEFIHLVATAPLDITENGEGKVVFSEAELETPVSRYAENLIQLDNSWKQISNNPAGWKCEESGMTENLWLNLSTGHIGSGRPQADGSGGTGAALRHFKETGYKYPLVVKLGTITKDGADVYSYAEDEDEMVKDPWLNKHLLHWGLDMKKMQKSDYSMQEIEVKMNTESEFFDVLPAFSCPGVRGITNFQRHSHMTAALQLLLSIPELKSLYFDHSSTFGWKILENTSLHFLLTKLADSIYRPDWILSHTLSEIEMEQDFQIVLPAERIPPQDDIVAEICRLCREAGRFNAPENMSCGTVLAFLIQLITTVEPTPPIMIDSIFKFYSFTAHENLQSHATRIDAFEDRRSLDLVPLFVKDYSAAMEITLEQLLECFVLRQTSGQTESQTLLTNLPPYLIIHLNRNTYSRILNPILMPESCDFAILKAPDRFRSFIPGTDDILDGESKYDLVGFVVCFGRSFEVNNVCFLKKENHGWIMLNNEHVALIEHPPFSQGDVYLYRRV